MAPARPGARPGAARAGLPAFLLGHDRNPRAARNHRHRRGRGRCGPGLAGALLTSLLRAGRCDGPLLALRGHRVDFSVADALPDGWPRPLSVEAVMAEHALSPRTYT